MTNFKVGDKLVENGRVYEIFKIEDKEIDNNMTTIIFFRPVFDEGTGLMGSIPIDNISDGEYRTPSTTAEVNNVLKILSKSNDDELRIDTDEMDTKLKTNLIVEIAEVANLLWIDKNNEDTSFSPTKRRLFKKALRAVMEEYAIAKDTSLDKAEKTIRSYLKRAV